MTKTVMLNSEEHKDLRINTEYSPELGDGVMWAQTFAAEFRNAQAHYPILFQKDSQTGKFMSVALLGFEQGENLFMENGQWNAGYVPLMIQRIPFSIGVAKDDLGAEDRRLINVDIEHPKVNREHGQRLFEEHGAATPFLDRVSGMLETIHVWYQDNEVFLKALEEFELLEQVSMDITLDDGTKGQLLGFYTIDEKKLRELTADKLADLHRRHYLEPIYMAIASIAKVRSLMERKVALNTAADS
ncbi:SapC family protein [Gilvimarinus sp. SDUM040013]|uniref:SapC family protein n=1 Tax=Gilvimarinus gilvus TaxID=3058038 RepID=A0ABU4RYC6_9GAMM|nr:SapC family protein [Gilvimarinus sp. SDUM040013]MDO3388495.1 SapC family protein [Gilvimarinus sp. SDUM040013]MDX6848633.1 SapC family protein [Gilvimarinus sp. SDUM040013]